MTSTCSEHRNHLLNRWAAASVLTLGLFSTIRMTAQTRIGPVSVPGTAVVFDPDQVLSDTQLAGLRSAGALNPTPAVKVLQFPAEPGQTVMLSASGSVGCCGVANIGPDGYPGDPANITSLGSISGFISPNGLPLVGVFTNGSPSGTAPQPSDYSGGLTQATFSPLLNQVFFIGDGLTGTGSGSNQVFKVPDTATELWLGFVDGGTFQGPPANYGDNAGALTVTGTLMSGPSLLTLAHLSDNIYEGNAGYGEYRWIGNNCTLPPNTCLNVGLAAGAYIDSNRSQIVVAIRGTVIDLGSSDTRLETISTLIDADLRSFAGTVPSRVLRRDVSEASAFVKQVQSRYPAARITLTGHSLGGAIAQLISQASGLPAYVFNAVGGERLYSALLPELGGFSNNPSPIYINVNYRLYADQISLIGLPPGSTITLQDPPHTDLTAGPDTPCSLLLPLIPSLLHLHSMDTVLEQIREDAPQVSSVGEPNILIACNLPH